MVAEMFVKSYSQKPINVFCCFFQKKIFFTPRHFFTMVIERIERRYWRRHIVNGRSAIPIFNTFSAHGLFVEIVIDLQQFLT